MYMFCPHEHVRNAQGFDVTDARFIWKPKAPMECAEEEEDKNLTAIEMLEELDDVDAVWHNMS